MGARSAVLAATLFFFLASVPVNGQKECNVYIPNADNIIVMDVEQRGPGGGWEFQSSLQGYGGSGYLSYKPWSSFGGTEPKPYSIHDERIKTYFFTVNVTGTYRVVMRSAAPHPTEHNDLWMSLPESGAVKRRFGETSNLGSPAWTNDAGEVQLGTEHWFKVFQNSGGWRWNWGGKTVDHNGHDVISRVLRADGSWYSVRIAGRSTQFAVDRIALYLCEGAECDNGSQRFNMATIWHGADQSVCE
ncbi:unnamed protein product [Agarophyton chilense]